MRKIKAWWTSTSDRAREEKSWFFSIVFHGFLFILLVTTGALNYTPLKTTNIVEITAVSNLDGIGAEGGSIEKSYSQPEEIPKDAILEHSQNSKVKITYDELNKRENKIETQELKEISNQTTDKMNDNNVSSNNVSGVNSSAKNASGGNSSSNIHEGNGKGNGIGENIDTTAVYSEGGVDQKPRFLHREPPYYPDDLAEDGVTGTTVVSAILNRNGEIESVNIVKSSGNRRLDNEAIKAVRKFKFTPAKIKNTPVKCRVNLPIRFGLQ